MKKLKLSVKNKEPVPCGQPLPQQGGCRLLAKKTGALLSLAAVLHMNYAPLTLAATTTVSAGTSATGQTLNNGDLQNVYGTATSTTISSGAQHVSNGGLATSTTISGGAQHVSNGGLASDTTIDGGGQVVSNGGSATSTTINFRGEQCVSNGGSATSTTISGGAQFVIGGSASDTTIHSGGAQYVSIGGTATSTTINASGAQFVSNGGTATSTTISSGGEQYVLSDGSATSTTIYASGAQYVSIGGSASDTTIHSGGSQVVYTSGSASDTTIDGGVQHVSNGGLASDTNINGGAQYVLSDGTATSTTINASGLQVVYTSGSASDTTIHSGGLQFVSNGGLATSTTINGGFQFVSNGGLASDTTIGNGAQYVSIGGLATSTTINSGGGQVVYTGGLASDTSIYLSGGQIVAGGSASDTTIHSGGSQFVSGGGTATSTTISSGGFQYVQTDGTAISTTIYGGLMLLYSGAATSTTIYGGTMQLIEGGTATSTTINSGGSQSVLNGGTATSTTIYSGGAMHLYGGGSAVNATLLAGAELAITRGSSPAVYNSGTTDFTDKKLSFYLDGADNGDIMLSTNTALQVTDATDITLLYSTSSNLSSGETITLINRTTEDTDFTSRTAAIFGGGATVYDFDLTKNNASNNALEATFQGVNQSLTTESAKAYLEGAFSKLSHLGAADNTAQESLQTAWQSGYGRDGFFAFNGGKTKTKTGSYVDANHFNLAGGISHKKELKNGRSLMTAILLEGGWGSYDTYNSFSTGQVRGSGDTSHYGLGLAVKNSDSNGRYLEGSLRAGRVESDYKTGDMGTGADFETKSTYWSAHIGLGRARQLKDGDLLDTYLKLFHTRQGSDSVHTGAGERLELDSANSTRLRLGARYTKGFHEKTSYYAGLALEYEFSGKQGGSIDGVRIDAPDMKGSSAMLELGAKYELSKGWSADFALQGLVGKRQGIGGNLMFNYRF